MVHSNISYLLHDSFIGLNLLLRFKLSNFHNRPVNYITVLSQNRTCIDQYKFHAYKHNLNIYFISIISCKQLQICKNGNVPL